MKDQCPCGSGNTYENCCAPLHLGTRKASTAEALMRSRYSAFVKGDTQYLLTTWHPVSRPGNVDIDQHQQWLGLKIRAVKDGSECDDQGEVEFIARCKINGRAYRLHETSTFRRQNGQWFYLEGVIHEPEGG